MKATHFLGFINWTSIKYPNQGYLVSRNPRQLYLQCNFRDGAQKNCACAKTTTASAENTPEVRGSPVPFVAQRKLMGDGLLV